MNRRMLPLIFMLLSGAITCIATWIHGYSAVEKLVILLIVLLIFGTLGSILQRTINYFEKQNKIKVEEAEKEKAEQEKAESEVKDKQKK